MARASTIGQRRTAVVIEGLASTTSPGFPEERFEPIGDPVYLARIPQTLPGLTAERVAAGQESARITTEWRAPYFAALDPDLVDVPGRRRLRVGERLHDILAADFTDETRREIRLVTLAKSDRPEALS